MHAAVPAVLLPFVLSLRPLFLLQEGESSRAQSIDSFNIALLALTYAIRNSIAYAKNDLLGPNLVVRYVFE